MRLLTKRDSNGPDDPDAYWRRRFFILGGGLGVLMLVAWLAGGGGGPSKQASQTAATHAATAARQERSSLPGAGLSSPSALASPSPSPSRSASARPVVSHTPSAKPSASASGTAKAGGKRCPAGSMVLSLFTSAGSYRPSEQPKFTVYSVSTSAAPCTMAFGPGAVRVVVTRRGHVVWNSASCKSSDQGQQTAEFSQGVPQEVSLTWNRKASAQSCAGTLVPGEWGTFQAVAKANGHSSPVRTFKLLS
jgi:hypothetical protein